MRFVRIPRPLLVALLMASSAPAVTDAGPVLRMARADVTFSTPNVCEVALTAELADALSVEHRLEVLEGVRVEMLEVRQARTSGGLLDIGRTRALHVVPTSSGAAYTLRYRVTQPASHRFRCPIWLPAIATDGRSRAVQLAVSVPEGTAASATMPAFAWTGRRGTANLAHLPAFVIVPFHRPGEARPWDVARIMDLVAFTALVSATAWWLHRRTGRA